MKPPKTPNARDTLFSYLLSDVHEAKPAVNA